MTVRSVEQGQHKQGQPVVMTMHRAKGMEFSRVLLFGVNKELIPAEYLLKDLTDADRADALTRERSLLYVAATRARDELVVTSSGSRSGFLPPVAGSPAIEPRRLRETHHEGRTDQPQGPPPGSQSTFASRCIRWGRLAAPTEPGESLLLARQDFPPAA